jgi:hypothetical protein
MELAFSPGAPAADLSAAPSDVGLTADYRLYAMFFIALPERDGAKLLSMIGHGTRRHQLFNAI